MKCTSLTITTTVISTPEQCVIHMPCFIPVHNDMLPTSSQCSAAFHTQVFFSHPSTSFPSRIHLLCTRRDDHFVVIACLVHADTLKFATSLASLSASPTRPACRSLHTTPPFRSKQGQFRNHRSSPLQRIFLRSFPVLPTASSQDCAEGTSMTPCKIGFSWPFTRASPDKQLSTRDDPHSPVSSVQLALFDAHISPRTCLMYLLKNIRSSRQLNGVPRRRHAFCRFL